MRLSAGVQSRTAASPDSLVRRYVAPATAPTTSADKPIAATQRSSPTRELRWPVV